MNPMELMKMLNRGLSPQQIITNLMGQSRNPIGQNLLQLAQQGKGAEIEQIARNLCQSKGIDFDKEFKAFKEQLGFK